MEFRILNTDKTARNGIIIFENKKISTPNIFYDDTKNFKKPDFAELTISSSKKTKVTNLRVNRDISKIEKKEKNIDDLSVNNYFFYPCDLPADIHLKIFKEYNIKHEVSIIPPKKELIDDYLKNNSSKFFIISNSYQLFQKPKKFVDFLTTFREKIGYEKTIYLPGVAEPQNMGMLCYLGVDFFDSIQAIIAARNNKIFFPYGKYNLKEFEKIPCNCPTCFSKKSNPKNLNFENILNHNYYQYFTELSLIKNSIKNNSLEEIIETRIKNNVSLTAIYRYFLMNNFEILEKSTPVASNRKLLSNCYESFWKPEIVRFQNRLITDYRKPKKSEILLVLPCSSRKPYIFSKSHRLFKKQIYDCSNSELIHELIITSPLGLVPRELEIVYPANNYDIPVTGYWDENEKKMMHDLIDEYLKINNYKKIVVHLKEDFIKNIFKERSEETFYTCMGHPTSNESLDKLKTILEKISKEHKNIRRDERKKETIKSLASYQFGRKIAEKLIKGTIVKGKYPYLKIFYDNKQLGMMSPERGYISLTLDGAKKIKNIKQNFVYISDDFKLKGSVFTPGIIDADEKIRAGDEVLVFQKNKLIAVGVSKMSGDQMKNTIFGEAVKVRHHV